MVTERRAEKREGVIGFGVEDKWVMESLKGIVELGRTGRLKEEWFYEGSPDLLPQEAECFGRIMDAGKVRVQILPFRSPTYMNYQLAAEKGEAFFRIDMRCDVAAVVYGISGFDRVVYPANNKYLVQIVKDISKRADQVLPK